MIRIKENYHLINVCSVIVVKKIVMITMRIQIKYKNANFIFMILQDGLKRKTQGVLLTNKIRSK